MQHNVNSFTDWFYEKLEKFVSIVIQSHHRYYYFLLWKLSWVSFSVVHFVPFHDHLCMNSEMENSICTCRGSLVSSALEWLWHLCEILLTIIKRNFTMNGINENHRGLIEDHTMKSHFPFLPCKQFSNVIIILSTSSTLPQNRFFIWFSD